MPIVDGLTSSKIIRSFEKAHPSSCDTRISGRVPIFAVSASLVERNRAEYIEAGFDGWILKPIDFQRLGVLLRGIFDSKTRNDCLYQPGEWERGGWFINHQPDIFEASTTPSNAAPQSKRGQESFPTHEDDPITKEQERLKSLGTDAHHAESFPAEPGQSGNIETSVAKGKSSLP